MKKIHIGISVGLFILFVLLLSGQQEVFLSIKEGLPAIPLALPEFLVHDTSEKAQQAAEILHTTLAADLKYSRIFQELPKSYYSYIRPLNPNKIFFKDWESIQAKILFVGEVSDGDDGNILFEGRVYDVKAERGIFGKRYQADPELLRLAAHKMADELMKMWGEKPIFTSKILFVSNRDGNDELYMMDYDGHDQVRLTFNRTIDYMPAWSPDRKKIAYTSYRGDKAILYIWNLEKQERYEVFGDGTPFAPSFSPDGKRLAFCSQEEGGNSEIYVATSDGKHPRRLTFNKAIDTAPTWSPTSRQIAFTSDRGGTPQIYIMDAEGSNVTRVSFGGTYHDGPAWSPTGDMIAYVSRVDQIFDIYVLNLRSRQIIKLTEGTARNESPSWSPDGRHLVFSSNRNGSIQLYTVDYDGQNLRRLTSKGENKLPDWSH
ncbi:MAG: Tol-Pal system beta propeller repeat protein TolB [Candidatus Aminicenantales bacterium]